jgi:hypothetical protein
LRYRTGPLYRAWLEENVPTYAERSNGIWKIRCSLVHQGRATPDGEFRVGFTPADTPFVMHTLSIRFMAGAPKPGEEPRLTGEGVDVMNLPMFVDEVTRAAEAWLDANENTEAVQRNLRRFARLHPEGIPPNLQNVPIIY